jgi:multiple sugar transport system substrate-binding protein
MLALLLAACGGGGADQTQTVPTEQGALPTEGGQPTEMATEIATTAATEAATTEATAAATGEATAEATAEGTAEGQATSGPAMEASGALSVLGFGQPDEIATVRVDTFRSQYPDVDLQLSEGALDQQQFLTSVASGNPPDLVYIDRDLLGTYATRGAIMPLDDCISRSGIDMSQFREAAVNQVTVDGQVYGIPEFYNIIVVIANNQALQDAGLTAEEIDTANWDQLAQANDALTRVENGNVTRIGFDPKLPEFLPLWVHANGGQMLSDDGRTAMLDDPKVVEALNFTAGLHDAASGREPFMAFRDTWDFFGGQNQFVTDQLGAFPMEHWYLNVLVENSPDVDISVMPFHDRQGQAMTYATGSAWAIPQGAKNPDAACALAATMTAPATWVAAARARADARSAAGQPFTGIYTANRVADEQIFDEIYQPSGNQAFDDGVQTVLSVQDQAFSIPANPAGAEFRQAWQDAVNRVLNGEQTAEEALAQAQQEAQAALDDAWSR